MQVLVRLCILSHFNILKKGSYSTLSSYIQFNIGYHYSLSLSLLLIQSLSLSFIHSLSLIILPNTVCCKYFMQVLVRYMYII